MKIEKLTENKIRIIMNSDEFGLENTNVYNIMSKAIEKQDIFLDILKKAEKEVDFYTDGCKLLIEGFSSLDDIFVFTITKYLPDNHTKKKIFFNNINQHTIYRFRNFDIFCEFCNAIKHIPKLDHHKLAKNIALYFWKNNYYLIFKNMNYKYEYIDLFFSTLSEFSTPISFSNNFEYKLLEHGKVMIKKNAIDVGIDFFVE